ncbi:hypothetical protein LUW74_31025 [Actinomadura madurae]|uniref:hypothetical protein n=1 Tax=Actinomadura madurae TaxID=1993 RepID=UPI0020270DAD|nr:hypothetical protein [Actinomadura madurae]URN07333.1 hypothetical protein LUW74_31025 [Actinomadura madurae]
MTPTTRDHGRAALPAFRYARPPRPDAAFETVPRYRRGDGGLTGRPAAGGPFSVARLAAGFTPQALDRGLFPESPWADSARVRFAPPRPSGRSAPAEFAERFEGVLERVIGDREAVAVALAGDLESAALVDRAARVCRRTGRTLLAVTVDDADDLGRRSRHLSERLLEHLGLRCRHLAVAAVPGRWPEPEWSEHGPRFELVPRFRSGTAIVAAEAGAEILLHGTGGERLLRATPYLAARYLRSRSLHDLTVYWRDGREAPRFPAGELLAAMLPRTGRGRAARLFWAWTGLGGEDGEDGRPGPLTAPMAAAARTWSDALREEGRAPSHGPTRPGPPPSRCTGCSRTTCHRPPPACRRRSRSSTRRSPRTPTTCRPRRGTRRATRTRPCGSTGCWPTCCRTGSSG